MAKNRGYFAEEKVKLNLEKFSNDIFYKKFPTIHFTGFYVQAFVDFWLVNKKSEEYVQNSKQLFNVAVEVKFWHGGTFAFKNRISEREEKIMADFVDCVPFSEAWIACFFGKRTKDTKQDVEDSELRVLPIKEWLKLKKQGLTTGETSIKKEQMYLVPEINILSCRNKYWDLRYLLCNHSDWKLLKKNIC